MLELDDDHYEALVAHARAEYPNEACGLLLPVPADRLGDLVADLRIRGIEPAVVGRVTEGPPGRIAVRRLPPR